MEWRELRGQQGWGWGRWFEERGWEEAQALSLPLVSLALSNGQSLGVGVPGTTGEGSPFSRYSAMPTTLVHIKPPRVWPLTCAACVRLSSLQAALVCGTLCLGSRVSGQSTIRWQHDKLDWGRG